MDWSEFLEDTQYIVFKVWLFFNFQMEIAKRLNAIIAQLLPFLSQEVSIV